MEEWGEAYQALSWGPLVASLNADLQPGARTDKVSQPALNDTCTRACACACVLPHWASSTEMKWLYSMLLAIMIRYLPGMYANDILIVRPMSNYTFDATHFG